MSLIDELREIAAGLNLSQIPAPAEEGIMLAALIYYVDTRMNAAPPAVSPGPSISTTADRL